MLKKSHGLVYRKGRWHVKNYGRALKKGGLTWGNAKILAWWRNRKGEIPPIKANLKRKRYSSTGSKLDDYPIGLEPGDLVAFRESSPFIKTAWDEPSR